MCEKFGGKEWNIMNVFFFILFQKYVTECGILEAKKHFIFNDFSFNSQTNSWLIFTLQKKTPTDEAGVQINRKTS